MRGARPVAIALVAISLLAGGCESLRPPAQESAVREQEQKPSEASAGDNWLEDLLYWTAYYTGSALVH